jgi:hypothetical protein
MKMFVISSRPSRVIDLEVLLFSAADSGNMSSHLGGPD